MTDIRSYMEEAASRGATADQLRELHSRLQSQQPAGQSESYGEQPSPQNFNVLYNQQSIPQRMVAYGQSPTDVDLSDLPQSGEGLSLPEKLKYASQAVGRGLVGVGENLLVKPVVGVLGELMLRSAGEIGPATEGLQDRFNISPEAFLSLMMMSPVIRVGLPGAIPIKPPIGNRAIALPGKAAKSVATTGKDLAKGLTARSGEELQQVAGGMKSSAGDIYGRMREIGAVLNSNSTKNLLDSIDESIASQQFIPELNPKTLAIVNHLKAAASEGTLGLNELDQYRRMLSRVGSTEDGVSAGAVRRTIDDIVSGLKDIDLAKGGQEAVQLLKKGRAEYSKASKFDEISDIMAKAGGDPNRIKSGLSRFVNNADNLRGYTPNEVMALRNAAKTGVGENLLKAFGKFGFDFGNPGVGNTALPALSAALGYAGVPGGIPLAFGGTVARQGQKYLARGKAEKALQVIERGQ